MMEQLLSFLDRLETNRIYYRLNKVRDAILVEVAVPGERWEIEFFEDSHIEIERFISEGIIMDELALEDFFERYSN